MAILLESADRALLESADVLLLEDDGGTPPTTTNIIHSPSYILKGG
jgi:hypothetical protein